MKDSVPSISIQRYLLIRSEFFIRWLFDGNQDSIFKSIILDWLKLLILLIFLPISISVWKLKTGVYSQGEKCGILFVSVSVTKLQILRHCGTTIRTSWSNPISMIWRNEIWISHLSLWVNIFSPALLLHLNSEKCLMMITPNHRTCWFK